MVANKYAFLQITRRRFLNEWEAFKKVISRRNIRRRITIPLTLSNLKLLRRITRTENILHRNFTRRQVAIQNRVASNIGIRDRKSGSAGMPRPISYAVFCLKKKNGTVFFYHQLSLGDYFTMSEVVPHRPPKTHSASGCRCRGPRSHPCASPTRHSRSRQSLTFAAPQLYL